MNSKKTNKLLLIAGMLLVPITSLLVNYLKLPDLVFGLMVGISSGLIIYSLIVRRHIRPDC
ncbi:MAG: hypothetical protein ACXVB0_13480 [Mucilaginibacter sp.]